MSGLARFVGKKKPKAEPKSLDDTGKRIEERGDTIQGKIDKLDKELMMYKKKMQSAKGPALANLKRRALDVLKRKKMYEKQRDQLSNQQFNIDQQSFMVESMKDTIDTVDSMKANAKVMKKEFKKINIDKIEDLQDDISDMMYDHEEVQEVMGRALGWDADDVDEDELDAELAGLDELDLNDLEEEEEDADYLKTSSFPSAPTAAPAARKSAGRDQYGLPAVPIADP